MRTSVLYTSITNLYCLSTVCDMLGGLFHVLDMIWNQKIKRLPSSYLAYRIDRNLRSENGSVSLELDL